MSMRRRNGNVRGVRLLSRIALIGATAAVALWYVLSGARSYETLVFPGLVSLALVAGLVGFGRIRARERWNAAWDAYAAQDGSRDAIGPYQEEGMLSMAGTR
jgi:hypothetical protein